MAFRDDLQALQARHAALEAEAAAKVVERDLVRGMLDEARTRAKLPVLDNIRVASPCHADWAKMSGDERTRHCGDCKKNVYNLSDMTREEAEALIVAQEGELCVRYFQRHDGTILLADCTIGAKRQKRKKLVMIAGAAAMLATGGVVAYKKLAHHAEEPQMVMGQMIAPPPVAEVHEIKGELVAPPKQVIQPQKHTAPKPAQHEDGDFVMGRK